MVSEVIYFSIVSDHWHLNKAPIKIQSLSLLTGSGSDRQHKYLLFWFQKSSSIQNIGD